MSINSWTVLIYADGNNELEPEITEAVERLKIENIESNFNILVQLARADEWLVKKFRGSIDTNLNNRWSGVRRYLINENGPQEVEVLENVNMADPKTLYDFLLWGLNNYKADKVMVVLSGHGAGFVGAMTDFTFEKPYMMSLDGLINVFYMVYEQTRIKIEVVLLDSCYMNLVEIWYEFLSIPFNPIRYLLVANDNIGIEGISYFMLIRYLQVNRSKYKETKDVLINTIDDFNKNDKIEDKLILVNLEKTKFETLKNSLNNISKIIIENNIDIKCELKKELIYERVTPFISIIDLCIYIKSKLKLSFSDWNIDRIIRSIKYIVIYPDIDELSIDANKGPAVYLPINLYEFDEFKEYYDKLLFSYDNNWRMILDRKREIPGQKNEIKNYNTFVSPIILKVKYVISSILEERNNILVREAIDIIEALGWNKNL